MSFAPAGKSPAPFPPLLVKGTWLILGMAALLTAVWLWCCWCSFPAIPWNDIRIAPAVALHQGISVYSTATAGPVSTWTYGPVPLLVMWPAGLAASAVGALQIAGVIHIGLTVLALAAVCLCWPGGSEPVPDRLTRLAVALLCVLLIRNETSGYIVYSADAPGRVLSMLSLLALGRRQFWLAALGAAAATACKQTFIGVALAQFIWLWAAVSPRAAWQQLGRCAAAGAVIALAAIVRLGVPGLWYVLVELPGRFPWAPLLPRMAEHVPYLLLHLGLPLALMLGGRRFFFDRRSPLMLASIAFCCTLPFGLAGFFKNGGNVNSLHSFWLWFPPALIALTTGAWFSRHRLAGNLAVALVALGLASAWLQISRLPVRPNTEAYREADYLATRLPGKIWFPLHPLITLYSDKRLYHDLDGLVVRTIVRQPPADAHFAAGLPPQRQATAMLLPVGWQWADIAEARLPQGTPAQEFGVWRIDGSLK